MDAKIAIKEDGTILIQTTNGSEDKIVLQVLENDKIKSNIGLLKDVVSIATFENGNRYKFAKLRLENDGNIVLENDKTNGAISVKSMKDIELNSIGGTIKLSAPSKCVEAKGMFSHKNFRILA